MQNFISLIESIGIKKKEEEKHCNQYQPDKSVPCLTRQSRLIIIIIIMKLGNAVVDIAASSQTS